MLTPNVIRPIELWRDPRHRRGIAGELAAAHHLEANGWTILAHRFRFGRHDLDLIARRGSLVAFVEVKGRRSDTYGSGREGIGWRKRLVLESVARCWISDYGEPNDRYRFDVVEVSWGESTFPQVTHIEDAWRAVRK